MSTDYYREQLEWSKAADRSLFNQLEVTLPWYPDGWPGGFKAHYIDPVRMAVAVVQPRGILEIGFNLGRSALLWLGFSAARVLSVDINDHPLVRQAADVLLRKYPDRFDFILATKDDRQTTVQHAARRFALDTVFIDGGHEYEDVMADIALAKSLGIRKMIFDDWHPHWGPGVQPAIAANRLKIHAVFGNLAYCEDALGVYE